MSSSFHPLVLALSKPQQAFVPPVSIPTPSVVASVFTPSATTVGDLSLKKAAISVPAWTAFGRK